MIKLIEQKIPTLIKMGPKGDSRAVIIPATWREIAGITDKTPLLMRLKETKYGFAIDIYKQKEEKAKK